jgi:hypothetical protein
MSSVQSCELSAAAANAQQGSTSATYVLPLKQHLKPAILPGPCIVSCLFAAAKSAAAAPAGASGKS